MPKKIKIVIANPGEKPRQITVPNMLSEFQKLVGGYIEAHPFILGRKQYWVYCNEEGVIRQLPWNRVIDTYFVRGPLFVSRIDASGEDIGLTEPEITDVMAYLGDPVNDAF